MGTLARIVLVLLSSSLVIAGEFQTGQAARAVIGQSSFSSHDVGILATALSTAGGKLFVADSTQQIFTFDLTQIPDPKDDLDGSSSPCAVCGFSPATSVHEPVMPGIAAVSVWGRSLTVADPVNHRVLIWRDTAKIGSETTPDVVLGSASFAGGSTAGSSLASPVSVAFDGKHLFVGDGALHRVLVWDGLPSGDNQPPAVILGQGGIASALDGERVGSDMVGVPGALASDGTNLFVADTANRRILVFSPGDMALASNQLTNSATLQPGVFASGSLVSLRGNNFADENEAAPDDAHGLPRKLAGVKVLLNGSAIPLTFAGPAEVRAQLPYNLGNGSASVYVRMEHADGSVTTTNAIGVRLVTAAPGIFAFGGSEPRGGIVLHSADGNGKGTPVTDADPAKPGEIITVWATGLGAVEDDPESPVSAGEAYDGGDLSVLNPVRASIAGRPAEVLSASLPKGSLGIYEIRIHLPPDLSADRKTPLFISQAGSTSNTVTFASGNTIQ